ncbi:hypothetical protein I4U23_018613 [Adineta vaga]|nr:hypothetical protein I4U23_018613 [Adineta vaga]
MYCIFNNVFVSGFCQQIHGHIERYHSTNTRQNKECNIFVSQRDDNQLILVRNEGKGREYKPDESCKPEVCTESCEGKDVKFYFIAYRDRPSEDESYVIKFNPHNLTNDSNIINFLEVLNDADEPKYITHIADSSSHRQQYVSFEHDNWPGGYPCDKAIEDKFLSNVTSTIFQKHSTYFEENYLNRTLDLGTKFLSILSRDLLAKEIDSERGLLKF